jgi:hypothetical protein
MRFDTRPLSDGGRAAAGGRVAGRVTDRVGVSLPGRGSERVAEAALDSSRASRVALDSASARLVLGAPGGARLVARAPGGARLVEQVAAGHGRDHGRRGPRLDLAPVIERVAPEHDLVLGRHVEEHLGAAEEQGAARREHGGEAREDLARLLEAEVDEDVAAEDHVPAARRRARGGVVDEVVRGVLDVAAHAVVDRHQAGRAAQVAAERGGDLLERRLRVDPLARARERLLDDVRGEHVEVLVMRTERLLRHHGDRVGLLARRAARAPDRDGQARAPLGQEPRQHVALERGERARVAEEARLPHGQDVVDLLQLRAPARVVLEVADERAHVGEAAVAEPAEEARGQEAPAVLRHDEAGPPLQERAEHVLTRAGDHCSSSSSAGAIFSSARMRCAAPFAAAACGMP